ncbi:hypothetical protein ACO0RG_002947 [Hanseniaspora osmophila]|uniref:Protein EFR3 n=1 Tax=Hanseniaspora osmophila TaxID=56408 RepID=A0A1E5R803_9ASCO|nr:Protein EFR3 [Hanseniaspora osmophila]
MALRNLFSTKHQRLVNQCYPTGKTTEKRAKSSETSYLIYYVNSRRTKLDKVSVYLLKRSMKDIHGRRIGNIAVTLELMGKIIVSCKENLSIFLSNFLKILLTIEDNKSINGDSSIVQGLIQVLENLCSIIDVNLITPNQLTSFEKFIALYFTTICGRSSHDSPQASNYNEYILKGCIAITGIKGIKFISSLRDQLFHGAYQSLKLFQQIHPHYLTPDLNTQISEDDALNKRLTLTRSITHRQLGLDDYADEKTQDLSIISLKKYFNTLETDILPISIRALIKVLIETPNKELFEFVVNGIPVQTRYIAIIIIVNAIVYSSSSKDAVVLLKLVSTLVYTEVSIVGLSVVDTIKNLLNFQLSKVEDKDIVAQCTVTIGDLNTRTFYKDQTFDVIQEFLRRLNTNESGNLPQSSGANSGEKQQRVKTVLIEDLNCLLSLVKAQNTECISFELFINLMDKTYPDMENLQNIFRMIQTSSVNTNSMLKFYQTLAIVNNRNPTSESSTMAQTLLGQSFQRFGPIALLAGLVFFQQPENCKPNVQYYQYHLQASKFLNLKDYEQQAIGHQKHSTVFTNESLLNFYIDEGANRYSAKGQQILRTIPSAAGDTSIRTVSRSTTDVESQKNGFQSKAPSYKAIVEGQINTEDKSEADIVDSLMNTTLSNMLKMTPLSSPSMHPLSSPKQRAVSNDVHPESKSLHSLSYKKPSVSQLRKYVKPSKTNSSLPNTGPLTNRASQSVKSKVTNITFLLSELNDQSSEIPIRDPDEEEVIGLENYGKSSAQTKLKRSSLKRMSNSSNFGSIKSNSPSVNMHTTANKHPAQIDEEISDAFVDAQNDITFDDTTRGKLFE